MDNLNLNTHQTIQTGSPEVRHMNFIQRLLGVFVSPAETMQNLVAKPRILFPIIAMAVTVLLFYLSRYDLYMDFLRKVTQATLEQQNTQMSPEQMEASMKMAAYGMYLAPLSSILAWIIGTAVLFGVMKIFKGQGSYKQYLSITGYAFSIMIIYYILSAAVSFFSGNLLLDTSLANITNLLVPDIQGSMLYGFIRGLDLFSVWQYTVIGIGTVHVSKVSKGKVYSVVFLLYLVTVLINMNTFKFM